MQPERFAVVSDIHGNLAALQAVLADARARGATSLLNLGDSLYGPLDPRGTAELLLAPGLPALHLRGNQDRILIEDFADRAQNQSLDFTRAQLAPHHYQWLRALPQYANIGPLQLCHGTPQSDEVYLLEQVTAGGVALRPAAEVLRRAPAVTAPVLLCGHSHLPRIVQASPALLVVNPGSVGLPAYADSMPLPHPMEAGSPDARYALIELIGGHLHIEQLAVSYDYEGAAAQAERNGRPDWAHALRTGFAYSGESSSD